MRKVNRGITPPIKEIRTMATTTMSVPVNSSNRNTDETRIIAAIKKNIPNQQNISNGRRTSTKNNDSVIKKKKTMTIT